MKIALLTDGIPPFVLGGMQKHSYFLAKYLAQAGVEVELHIVVYDETPADATLPFSSEELRYLDIHFHEFPKSAWFPGHYVYNMFRLSKRMRNALLPRIGQFDFIYTKGFTGWALSSALKKVHDRPPIGVKLHGMNMFLPTRGIKQKLEQHLMRSPARMIMNNCDIVFSYGGKVSDTIHNCGVARKKIIEIPTGIERSWVREGIMESTNKRAFVFIGRYDPVKGIRELNQVLRDVSFPNAEFHFIGPIPDNVKVDSLSVHYHGVIQDQKKMIALLDTMDCLVLPSYSEGMPNVVIEAMARGVAILASNVGAVPALVDESNGLLIQEVSPKAIAAGIKQMVELSSADLDQLKLRSIEKIESRFLWEKISTLSIETIRSIIDRLTHK